MIGPLSRLHRYFGTTVPLPTADQPWWDKDDARLGAPRRRHATLRFVDDQVFLLGLDELFRRTMQRHERGELLGCAERVAAALDMPPARVPVEGYYAEHPDLVRYYQLRHALQAVPLDCEFMVDGLPEYHRLLAVTSSPIAGDPRRTGLLPRAVDPLAAALAEMRRWSVPALTTRAGIIARETDDISLVGLAARTEDPVVLAALRESVVLYALPAATAPVPDAPAYEWTVEPALAAAARRFIQAYNGLFGPELPPPEPRYARLYWDAYKRADVVGRCVPMGRAPGDDEPRHYHWVVVRQVGERLAVHDFWDTRLWTTAAYRRGKRSADRRGIR